MNIQHKLILKGFNQSSVLLLSVISIFALTAQETLAISLEPILTRKGSQIFQKLIGVDTNSQEALPVSQLLMTQPQKPKVSPASIANPTPIYIPIYPQGYPGYSPNSLPIPPNYPAPIYTPPPATTYPTTNYAPPQQWYPGHTPVSPQTSPVNPIPNSMPVYPGYIPGSPPVSPAQPIPDSGYPQGYPGYLSHPSAFPIAPTSTYIPVYPPNPYLAPPAYSVPNYTPSHPPVRSTPPVIINNY